MTERATNIRKPRTDGIVLWDLMLGAFNYNAVSVAHNLRLFDLLRGGPRTLSEICDAVGIERRAARAILTTCVAAGLLAVEEERYSLTAVAEDYLLETSPAYFGGFLDMLIGNDALMTFDSLKRAVLTNKSQVYGGDELFESHEAQAQLARAFTLGMHGHSAGASFHWPRLIDLSGRLTMLDVGGGSGAHSIGAAMAWPDLQAIVLEMPPVCPVAEEFAAKYYLQDRIKAHPADMWADEFPPADIHFYADIFHDWAPDKCRFLMKKSFDSLPAGGRLLLHEMLFDDEKTGPAQAAAYNVAMLLWTEGQQYSGRELRAMMAEAGFTDIEIKPAYGYWSLVSGRKP
ncbi:MAG TPA: methyltransferase [Blastocatellia bacterium]|nr:methyltransferase [Blastocatellia bacterium]